MGNKKILKEDKSTIENSYNDLLKIYNRHYGEYKSSESQDAPVSKESDMGEGKLFTKFIMKK
jgi:hypothetical protein